MISQLAAISSGAKSRPVHRRPASSTTTRAAGAASQRARVRVQQQPGVRAAHAPRRAAQHQLQHVVGDRALRARHAAAPAGQRHVGGGAAGPRAPASQAPGHGQRALPRARRAGQAGAAPRHGGQVEALEHARQGRLRCALRPRWRGGRSWACSLGSGAELRALGLRVHRVLAACACVVEMCNRFGRLGGAGAQFSKRKCAVALEAALGIPCKSLGQERALFCRLLVLATRVCLCMCVGGDLPRRGWSPAQQTSRSASVLWS